LERAGDKVHCFLCSPYVPTASAAAEDTN
jgi:hypothetical protein